MEVQPSAVGSWEDGEMLNATTIGPAPFRVRTWDGKDFVCFPPTTPRNIQKYTFYIIWHLQNYMTFTKVILNLKNANNDIYFYWVSSETHFFSFYANAFMVKWARRQTGSPHRGTSPASPHPCTHPTDDPKLHNATKGHQCF